VCAKCHRCKAESSKAETGALVVALRTPVLARLVGRKRLLMERRDG
jgi:hypothetical protein